MSEHRASLQWKRNTPDFKYETYDRTHTIRFEGGSSIQASSAVEYLGKKEFMNPEQALAAALSSCHFLTFLALAAKYRFVVDEYEDEAVAVLGENDQKKMAVTRVTLRPKVKFSGDKVPDAEKLKELHEKSHALCFISNSVLCSVLVEPQN